MYGSIKYSKTALSHQSFRNRKISGHFKKKSGHFRTIFKISGISGQCQGLWSL